MSQQMKVDEFCTKLQDWSPLFQKYIENTTPEVQDFYDWCNEFRDWMECGAQEATINNETIKE